MIQLAFEPAFDPFHAAFRLLRQTVFRVKEPVRVARMKVLDVYVVEPRRCLDIRLPNSLKAAARRAAACQSATYGRRPSANALFNRMTPMQDAAIQTLVLQNLLDADAFAQGQALRTDMPLSDSLADRIEVANNIQADLMKFLCGDLDIISFDGSNGLKDRTGLGEYRYDII